MSTARHLRSFTLAALALAAAGLVATSCMTPEFTFIDGGAQSTAGSGNDGVTGHCENRKLDADETDKDCGGIDCDDCALGRACETGGDCVNGSCTNGVCQDPSCTDDAKNGTETDLDCGGDACGPCGTDGKCETGSDCASQVCQSGKCKAATCTDRKLNQSEVDVDCGGECDACDVGQACVVKADCLLPPTDIDADANATATCTGMTCALDCYVSGRGDCNAAAADGCETLTNTDVAHCGACGNACSLDHATARCETGGCKIDTCADGYKNVDLNDDNGCEVHYLTDPDYCGLDGESAAPCTSVDEPHGTPSCVAGVCEIACVTGFDDCDGDVSNGCETNLDTSAKHCGSCSGPDAVCTGSSPSMSPFCADGECGETACSAGTGDCDGDTVCDDNLNQVANCGTCGNVCGVVNGAAACTNPGSGFKCSIASCDSDATHQYKDCDGSAVLSCETDVLNNAFSCGGCLPGDANPGAGKNCQTSVGTNHIAEVACTTGACKITKCEGDWADCDGAFANGCEVDTATSAPNCGGCKSAGEGEDCTLKYPNGNGVCLARACSFTTCKTNFADCENGLSDGCEANLQTTKEHCGGCGQLCATDSVTSANNCSNGTCNPTCTADGLKCDSNGFNGCEDKQNDKNNCGACGNVCATDSVTSTNSCSMGSCAPTCSGSGMSCDGDGKNGCEDTSNDKQYCGACGISCDESAAAHVTSNSCTSSVCVPACSGNYRNCDSNGANGCETDKASNANHCGACNNKCGGSAQTNVATASCSSTGGGTCSVTCNNSMCPDTSDSERKCVKPLGTVENCLSCGQVCAAGNYCTPSGCLDHLQIIKVNDSTTATKSVQSGGDLTFSHALETSKASNAYRAVFVLLANTANNVGFPPTVRYNGQNMTAAVTRHSSNQAWVGVYYLLGEQLPAAAGTQTVQIDGNDFNPQDWTARVVELINVDQSGPIADTDSAGASATCAADLTLTTTKDAWLLTALGEERTGASATALDGQTAWAVVTAGTSGATTMSTAYVANVAAGTKQVRWTCSNNPWAYAAVSINAEGTVP
jgi:hypothetical protein